MIYDVLVFGPLFCDLIFTDLPTMPRLGTEIFAGGFSVAPGGSAIVAAGLQRLGARVGLIADLGDDLISRIIRDMLDELGIDRRLIREHPYPLPQVTAALSFPHDRAFVTRFQKPDEPVDLETLLEAHSAKHFHIYGFLAALEHPLACQIAHTAGLTVSLDPGWDEEALRDLRLLTMIRELDVFLPSKSELCYIAQEENTEVALAKIGSTMKRGMIIMKNGEAGATAYSQEAHVSIPALPVTPVDTTGAGDSFDAGFLFRYVQGKSLASCLQYGAICGGLSTTKAGGATAAPTYAEVQDWLSKLSL